MNVKERDNQLQKNKDKDLVTYEEYMKRYEIDKIYCDKLDINYFKECIQKAVDELLIEDDSIISVKIEILNKMLIQTDALRDIFWLFTTDNIDKIAEPIKKAIKILENQ